MLPNSAHLQNLQGFLRKWSAAQPDRLDFSMHDRWVSVHPAVLAMTACAATLVQHNGGAVDGRAEAHRALAYLIRMGLFEFLGIDPEKTIQPHEAAGRFIPLTQISTSRDLSAAITDLVPLLHAEPQEADSIRYVFSELARNALEHSGSPIGAFICAQYYRQTKRVSIGIADAGIGIRRAITKSHRATNAREAISLALQPGITGTTPRLGGTESNAGAGLFFVKSIAALSRNFFVLYSEDTMFKLLKGNQKNAVILHADPRHDNHLVEQALPVWQGTVVGIDISMAAGQQFTNFLAAIRQAYAGETTNRQRKQYFKKIKFAK
jgi:anti-sigma regulatory factor (Ser/Thr protein kinase)